MIIVSRPGLILAPCPVNVAARLESASRPDRILVGPESYRLVQGTIPFEPAGPLQLKGVSKPIEACFVVEKP